ncbi:MAG: aminopeptidase P family protein [Bacteroidota bacterium]
MFIKEVYIQRRKELRMHMKNGVVLFLGNNDTPMNYPGNTYHFRQDSTFLYYFGLDFPGLAATIDLESGEEIIYGNDFDIDDIIWMGPQESIQHQAAKVGVAKTKPGVALDDFIAKTHKQKRILHFLPPYRADNKIKLHQLTHISFDNLKYASVELIKTVVKQRSIKDDFEIAEIERFMEVGYLMHTTAMKMAKPGVVEQEIAGAIEGIALSCGGVVSFPVILSKRGETLHNHSHNNLLKKGDLLLIDAGAESPLHYATDHTRVAPVGGKFSEKQKDIYEIVLKANMDAIKAIQPGVPYKEIHLLAAKVIAEGLKDLGIMKGNTEDAVANGAHAMFFPHGLGHMMGLDVHDMEDLGEDYVGYDEEVSRSNQFGTAYLRLARKLQPGFVLTVEPGIYFIPELIQQWKSEDRFNDYINYQKAIEYIGFGGVRIEDDVLVTPDGYKVFGKPIPKTVADVEEMMNL